jgi:hypothetical protein
VITVLVVIALLVAGAGLRALTATPWPSTPVDEATPATLEAAGRRRLRHLDRHPHTATYDDLRERLRHEGVPAVRTRFLLERAAQHEVAPFAMWLWLERFDADSLEIVVAADLTTRDLLDHLCLGTLPDLEELGLFARFNGLPAAGAPTLEIVPEAPAYTTPEAFRAEVRVRRNPAA